MKYISILRGINVSGQKKIVMKDLQVLYQNLGFKNILTYIQTGNVIFDSNEKKTLVLKNRIESAIEGKYKFHVPVEIRTKSEILKIIKNCPFGSINPIENGTKVLLTFLSSAPSKTNISKIQEYVKLPEKLMVVGKEVYLYCPNGYGKSKLSNNFIENKLGVDATTRNWKSLLKLYELSTQ